MSAPFTTFMKLGSNNVGIIDTDEYKRVVSSDYNLMFDRNTGAMIRWGKTQNDDPEMCVFGPEISDIEISAGKCSGGGNGGCHWCYKSNDARLQAQNMSLKTFKLVLDKLLQTPTLTQVALGITDLDANPDFIPIMQYCRKRGVVPNFTTTGYGMTNQMAYRYAQLAGAIAVSAYPHTIDLCYDTVKTLTHMGLKQVNIHLLYHAGNLDFVHKVLQDTQNDVRLKELGAVVLLGLKQRGKATRGFVTTSYDGFSEIVNYALENGIRIGFDSCSATKFMRYIYESDMSQKSKDAMLEQCEPCESSLFSTYVSWDAKVYPCSFMSGQDGWHDGISILEAKDFVKDVWLHPRMDAWRAELNKSCRSCPRFDV